MIDFAPRSYLINNIKLFFSGSPHPAVSGECVKNILLSRKGHSFLICAQGIREREIFGVYRQLNTNINEFEGDS